MVWVLGGCEADGPPIRPLQEGWSVAHNAVTPRQCRGARSARRPVPAHHRAWCV